jgi:uncharacterized phiE125 gp8 family phage protein
MRRFLVNKPLIEPISLVEAKIWLRVDHGDDDGLIVSLIQSAREMVEARTGRALMAQTWRVTMDDWPEAYRIALPLLPVASIAVVRVISALGAATVLAPASYTLEAQSDPPVLAVAQPLPPGRLRNGIEIDVVAGYGATSTDCPETLRQAMRLMLGAAYNRRGPDQGASDAADVTVEVEALLAPFKVFRFFRRAGERLQ